MARKFLLSLTAPLSLGYSAGKTVGWYVSRRIHNG
jgi:hypothetical protein